ncbi:hypothetical protein RclHR1_18410001 [Rhizophagus clarus]|uniref:Uncharacterized protein n=1 Tax=Rhizophagus clarus TaxID=94130 RepID=A0A2Z6QMF1_9GLOM|nr:hypothetical protein RclHR1_18410001 [Rhizophagus clarus]GES73936.1 hypothetical protein GLOIN_2v1652685 [Rhizophagus clarus]
MDFVESEKFTDEQKNSLEKIRCWNNSPSFKSFIQDIDPRWSVSLYLGPDAKVDRQISEGQLMEIKNLICNIRDIYTTRQFEENQKRLAKEQHEKEEKDRRERQKYEEKLKKDGADEERAKVQAELDQLWDDLEYEREKNCYKRKEGRKVQDLNSVSDSDSIIHINTFTCYFPVEEIKHELEPEPEPKPVIIPKEVSISKEVKNERPGIIKKTLAGAVIGSAIGAGPIPWVIVSFVKGVVDEIMEE